VIVENGSTQLETKSNYNISENTFKIYLPKLTVSTTYKEDAVVTGLVRLKNGTPLSNDKIRTDTEIKAGTHYGITLQVYISNEDTTAAVAFDDLEIQVCDDGTWKDLYMPSGSAYEIVEFYSGNTDPDLSKVSGLSASIADCSINGLSWEPLQDREGVEITVTGAQFTKNASNRYHDVTNWFTNLPANTFAMVKETVTDSVRSTVKIVFAKRRPSGVIYSTPQSVNTAAIRVRIPFDDLTSVSGTAPWSGMKGAVATTLNSNAVWNIIAADTFALSDKIIIVSNTMTGGYNAGQ
jgi:hypothetical protein